MTEEIFTTKMKRATRKAHAISDALVNLKMLLALNNDDVWAEGLVIFYEIFKFLELSLKQEKEKNLGKLFIPEIMNRSVAFEEDLSFYLGADWKKNYKIRESVGAYLSHLKMLLKNDSDLLMAYVYHLYMGVLSGGQILQKKRRLHRKMLKTNKTLGEAVTNFENAEISDLKMQLKNKMNLIAENLDESKKKLLIEESIKVFELNNTIIKTVRGKEKVAIVNLLYITSFFILLISVIYSFYHQHTKAS